ncbi:MAG: non-homologous end-joining DNA ligase [Fulvivirga sp.]|nr:non-homologous end-joining DNA ligase [Fulvivirga sp.]
MKIGKHEVELSNEEKVFFPKDGITKGDLIDYYMKIAERILPYMKDRPLMLQRFPDGIKEDSFYQKEASDYFPDWIKTQKVEKEGGEVNHVICNDKATLIYLVNQGTVTFHTWLSKKDKLKRPDKFIIDLDPPTSATFKKVREAAHKLKEFFDQKSVTTYLMTTGSSGLHIVLPLKADKAFDEVRETGKQLESIICQKYDDLFTAAKRKSKREDKIFFDIQRNAYAQTGVVPYSVRPIDKAPLATPLGWDELNSEIQARSYHIKNIFKRLAQKEDPWRHFKHSVMSITDLQEKMTD